MSAPDLGQIWKEVDPRFTRYIRIVGLAETGRRSVAVRTTEIVNGSWQFAPRSRLTWCDIERFSGKRGGYAFVVSDFGGVS